MALFCVFDGVVVVSMKVAILFARQDSIYKSMPDCDVYDIKRDARNYAGDLPVVAHPPCRAWASLRHCAKPWVGEKDLAHFAIAQIRKFGGVLEHPLRLTLWPVAGLPRSEQRDAWGGWSLPIMPMTLGDATHTVGLWSVRNRKTCRPSVGKKEYEATPTQLAEWLVKLASRCDQRKQSEKVNLND